MKKNILALAVAVLSITLYSCDNASGGNKNIIPVDPTAQTEATETTVSKSDSVKTETPAPQKEETENKTPADSATAK